MVNLLGWIVVNRAGRGFNMSNVAPTTGGARHEVRVESSSHGQRHRQSRLRLDDLGWLEGKIYRSNTRLLTTSFSLFFFREEKHIIQRLMQ